jgi:hypothetical protein
MLISRGMLDAIYGVAMGELRDQLPVQIQMLADNLRDGINAARAAKNIDEARSVLDSLSESLNLIHQLAKQAEEEADETNANRT